MVKRKIGILVFTKKIKERIGTKKDNNFFYDNYKYYGFNYIISEIDKKENEIKYISSLESELNSVDFVLISLTSYYDILNLINELKGKNIKSKVIVGGAGLLNFSLISKYIDIAVIGRGEGIINDVFEGKDFENVWYKDKDPNIDNIYKMGKLKQFIKYKSYNENSYGCNKKCYFCQYGWSTKTKTKTKTKNYQSGYTLEEDFLLNIDWNNSKRNHYVSALDGITEKTRQIINKPISKQDIINKIREIYLLSNEMRYSIKIFNIIGYEWEGLKDIGLKEIKEILKKSDNEDKTHRIVISLLFTHFVPMPLTPMENESVNFYNFRDKMIMNENYKIHFGNNIECRVVYGMTSHIPALENCIINRSTSKDIDIIEKVFLSKEYKKANSYIKGRIIKKYIPERLHQKTEGKILPYIEYPKGFDKAQERYYRLKKELVN